MNMFWHFIDIVLVEIKNFHIAEKRLQIILQFNDKAIKLYNKYKSNLKIAINILSSKMLECSLDSEHRDELWFPFTYEECVDGETIDKHTEIRCEPHMKLVRDNSDLRIYFYSKDDRIESGKKVMIGRIGRPPWNKK